WNVFGTGAVGSDGLDPTLNAWLRTNGEAAWFGWPSDDKIEALRRQWIEASDTPTRKELAAAIQARAFEVVPRPGTMGGQDRLSEDPEGTDPRARALPVERREGLTRRSLRASTPVSCYSSRSTPNVGDRPWLMG